MASAKGKLKTGPRTALPAPATFGPEHVGRTWQVEVVSLLTFDGDRVILERDYHDRGARARSLGLTP